MNSYIHAQILNMQALCRTFEQSCTLGAKADDGKINKNEERQLKQIKAATQRFLKELEKIKD